jgi:hypothetical protein
MRFCTLGILKTKLSTIGPKLYPKLLVILVGLVVFVLADSYLAGNTQSLYIVNPDYCILFGDLIHEVLSSIKDWIDSNSGIYTDYSNSRIGVL